MTASTATDPLVAGPVAPAEPRTPARWRAALRSPLAGPVVVLLGSAMLVLAGALPVWGTRLIAPQYPKGLDLWFHGGRVTGPVNEVNTLNHYIGMQPIDLARVPEMALWPAAIIAAALLLAVAVLWRGWLGRLALIGLWLVPVVVLIDIQRWLIVFGTELDPASALRLDPFVPMVLGPSQIWNFTVWTYPGPALIVIWLVALGATLARRYTAPAPERRVLVLAGSLAIAVVGTFLVVVPNAMAPAGPAATGDAAEELQPGPVDLALLVAGTPSGGTLVVPPGRYRTNLVIDRPIEMVAGGEVLLDGGGRGTVVTINASDVTLRGFRIAHTGGQVEEAAGIRVVGAARVVLEENTIEDFFTGIAAAGATQLRIARNTLIGSGQVTHGAEHAMAEVAGADVAGNGGDSAGAGAGSPDTAPAAEHQHDPITPDGDTGSTGGAAPADPHAGHAQGSGPGGQGDAISLWATAGVLIQENTLHAVRDGLYLNYVDEVLIDGNEIHHSRYAIHSMFGSTHTIYGNDIGQNLSGIVLMYTANVLAGRNQIADQRSAGTGFGIVLKDVTGIRIAENVLARNRVGLRAEGTVMKPDVEAAVLRNRFAANSVALSLAATTDMGFGANAFAGNLIDLQALEPGVERHNDWTYQGTGNTWDDYPGFDLDGDGIGDLPYTAGGAEQLLLVADPALEAFLTSPAWQVLSAAQELWESGRPAVIRDSAPRLTDHAVPLPDDRPDAEQAPWLAAGVLLVGGATALATAPRARASRRWGRS